METPNGNYEANGKRTNSFFEAIEWAKEANGNVVEVTGRNAGTVRWTPAPPAKKNRVRHVIINADGTETEFSRVRR